MLTELGKELRKLRIEHNERILDMATKIAKSTAFISAVETGKKSPPQGFEDLVIKVYGLGEGVAASLRRAASLSRSVFTLQPQTALGRDTAGLLARKMNTLSDDQLEEIKGILHRGGPE